MHFTIYRWSSYVLYCGVYFLTIKLIVGILLFFSIRVSYSVIPREWFCDFSERLLYVCYS